VKEARGKEVMMSKENYRKNKFSDLLKHFKFDLTVEPKDEKYPSQEL